MTDYFHVDERNVGFKSAEVDAKVKQLNPYTKIHTQVIYVYAK